MGPRPRRDRTSLRDYGECEGSSSSEESSSSAYSPAGPSDHPMRERDGKNDREDRSMVRRRSLRRRSQQPPESIPSCSPSSSSSSPSSSNESSLARSIQVDEKQSSQSSSPTQTLRSSSSVIISREVSCDVEDRSQTKTRGCELRKLKSGNGLRVRVPKRGGSPPLTIRRRAEQAAQAAASSFQAAFTLYKCIRRPFLLRNHMASLSYNGNETQRFNYDFTKELPPKLLNYTPKPEKQRTSSERREYLNEICYLLNDHEFLTELKKMTESRTQIPFNFSIGTLAEISKSGNETPMMRCALYRKKLKTFKSTSASLKSECVNDLELRDICVKLRHVHVPGAQNEALNVQCFLSVTTFPMGTSEPIPIDGCAPIENNVVFGERDGVTILLRSGNEFIDFERNQLAFAALIFKVEERGTANVYYGAQLVYETSAQLIELKTHDVNLVEQEILKKFLPQKHLSEITEAADLMWEVERSPHLFKAIQQATRRKTKHLAHLVVNFIDVDTEFADDRDEEEKPIREKSLTSKGCVKSCPFIANRASTITNSCHRENKTEQTRRSLKREIPEEKSSPPPLKRTNSVASSMGSNGNKKNQQNGVNGKDIGNDKNGGVKSMEPMEELRLRLDRMDQHAWLFKNNSLAFLEYFDPIIKPGIEGRLENIVKMMKFDSWEKLKEDEQAMEWLRRVVNPEFPPILVYEFYACTRKNVTDLQKVLFHGRDHSFGLNGKEEERIFKEGVRKVRADHPGRCVICGRSFSSLFSLLLHYHTSYPRFSIKIRLDTPSDKEYLPNGIFLEVCLDDNHSDECVLPSERDFDSISSTINRPQRLPKYELTRAQTSSFKKEFRMDTLLFTTMARPRVPVRFNHTVYANERWNSAFSMNGNQIARKMMFEYSMMCLYDYIDIDAETLRYMGLYNYFRWRLGPDFQKSPYHALRLFFIANYRSMISFDLLDRFHVHLLEIKNLRQITEEQFEDIEYMLTETGDEDPCLHLSPLHCPFSYYRLALLKRADEIFVSNEKKSFKGLQIHEDTETSKVMEMCVKSKILPSQLSKDDRETFIQSIDLSLSKNDQFYSFKANSAKVITGRPFVPESLYPQEWVLHYGVLFNATYSDMNLAQQEILFDDVPILKLPEFSNNRQTKIKDEIVEVIESTTSTKRDSPFLVDQPTQQIRKLSATQIGNLLDKGFTFPCQHKRPCLCENRYLDDGLVDEMKPMDTPTKERAHAIAKSSPFKLFKQRL